jgi:hypothetical protein
MVDGDEQNEIGNTDPELTSKVKTQRIDDQHKYESLSEISGKVY